ncbi:efflux transporter outer membrane subunit [Alistipes finegoldii]|uniref:efflux transporter outer membrane subunit n=1 Tax=Alistipes finegoldii TaxID=214856 RepID=UPI00242AE21E|nr:efflux transporter outer membrane subunit [Alistipes finegoldii]
MKHTILIAAALLTLSGCGVYKPYSRPEVETDDLYWNIPTEDTVTMASLSWRELFTDAQLQALIEKGLEQNTDLRIAQLRVEEAEAVLKNARLSYLPSVSLAPEGGVSRYDGTTAKTYNLGATAGWEVDIFGRVTNAKWGARAALEGSRAYEQAVQTRLVATISGSYYTLSMLDRQLAINERTLDTWEKTVHTLEALKRAGKSNDAAVLQAQANRMALESSVLSIRKSIAETENALSALLALPSQAIERGALEDAVFPETVSIGVPLQLLANRPDVRQAEHNLAQAFYATNAARAAFYPSLTLSGTLGWTNNGGGVVTNPAGWLANAVGSLVQPLFNRGANRANLKIAKARQEEAALLFRQSLLDAGKEVNDALTAWQTARQRLEIDRSQIETLREAVRKTELLMRHSPTTYLEVLTAQQSLLAAEQAEAQDRFDEIAGVIALYHALGGGL